MVFTICVVDMAEVLFDQKVGYLSAVLARQRNQPCSERRKLSRSRGPKGLFLQKYLIHLPPTGELWGRAQEVIVPDGDHQSIDLADVAIVMHQLLHGAGGGITLFVIGVGVHETEGKD